MYVPRFWTIAAASLFATCVIVANAVKERKQFYLISLSITKSSLSMAVIYVQLLVCVVIVWKLLRKIFFGELRQPEIEHLMERAWYAVTETCLAFTVFREDLSLPFLALFVLLLFLKCFHWLVDDRIDFMERSNMIDRIFHLRAISLLFILAIVDYYLMTKMISIIIASRLATYHIVFAFEYAILFIGIVAISLRYILHTIDQRHETPWEMKNFYMLYLDLFLGFVRAMLYIFFLIVMLHIHALPLFALRPMYLSVRAFKKALHDVIMSRRAIRYLERVAPDARDEDLRAASDNVCIICREEMVAGGGCKKLPCSHIFHTSCLRTWFQRQQTCPTCRLDIMRPHGQNAPGHAAAAANANGQGQPAAAQVHPPRHSPTRSRPTTAASGSSSAAASASTSSANASSTAPSAGGSFSFTSGDSATQFQNLLSAMLRPPGEIRTNALTSVTLPPMFSSMNLPPPPFMSPFPFGSPFFARPPTSSLASRDLSALSEVELRAMEGEGRAAIEARIRCLENIRNLLDSALLQMQQYSSVFARPPPPPTSGLPSLAPAPVSAPEATASANASSSLNTSILQNAPETNS